nr:beta-ketoacyl-ACP synthase III [Oligella urethralis]
MEESIVHQYAKIIGHGSALPKSAISNDELAKQLAAQGVETSDEWIQYRTGIRQRHIADASVQTSDLAVEAAKNALASAALDANDIDLIILATTTPDMIFPSTACIVQAKLGITNHAMAFDVQAVCSGFVYAVTMADSMIRSGNAKRALVIGAETFTRLLDWQDRGTCVLFGDGAGAIILEASEEPGILATQLNADGAFESILHVPGRISRGAVVGDPFMRMDGQAVFKKAVSLLERSALDVCDKAGISHEEIEWFVPHQANLRIINALGRKLSLPAERVVVTVDKHANTSAASVPLAFDEACRDGRIQPGQLVLLQGVGGGFTWGSVLLRA